MRQGNPVRLAIWPEAPTICRGRGLLLVQGLSMRTGFTGDRRGRVVWAQVRWDDPSLAAYSPSCDPYRAAVRESEAALAVSSPRWRGRSARGSAGGPAPA